MSALVKKALSILPARTDLTDREFTKILGGVLGGLGTMGTQENLRNAVRWWAETDEAWSFINGLKPDNEG